MDRQKKIKKLEKSPSDLKKAKFELNSGLITQAVSIIKQLQAATNENSKNLFELSKHSFLYINVILNALPSTLNIKPVQIALPKPIFGPAFSTKHVLIVSNAFKRDNKDALRALAENWKFISYEKISKNYKEYKDKLGLLKDYDLFFCEGKVYMLLKKHLGKHFYEAKKYPFPVNFDELVAPEGRVEPAQFRAFLDSLVDSSTYFVQGNGPEYSLKVARLDKFSDADFVRNVRSGVKGLAKLLISRGVKLSNVRRIVLKGEKTESFPIYTHLTPEERKLAVELLAQK